MRVRTDLHIDYYDASGVHLDTIPACWPVVWTERTGDDGIPVCSHPDRSDVANIFHTRIRAATLFRETPTHAIISGPASLPPVLIDLRGGECHGV